MGDPTDRGGGLALILASASPRRHELLARVGIAHEVCPSRLAEAALPGEAPPACAARLAADKAAEVASSHPRALVLGADTVVEQGGAVLGKPASAQEARGMLAQLSGRRHQVTTAVSLLGPAACESLTVTTAVWMRAIADDELDAYVEAGEWRGKAGGYAIQGMAAAFVTAIEGSLTNVIGLPLAEVIDLLARAGAHGPRYREGRPA